MCRVRVAKVQKEYDTYAQDKADLLDSEKKGLEQRLAVERAEKVAEMNIRIEKMWQARIKRELDVRHELCAARCGAIVDPVLAVSLWRRAGGMTRVRQWCGGCW